MNLELDLDHKRKCINVAIQRAESYETDLRVYVEGAYWNFKPDVLRMLLRSNVSPTLTTDGMIAALNRARHRGQSTWAVEAATAHGVHRLNADELEGVARLIIEREKAAGGGK